MRRLLACYSNASGFRGIFYHHFRTHPQPMRHFQGLAVKVVGAASLVVEYGSFSSALKVLVIKGQRCRLL
ncbi:hypothetical protein T06_11632 [Trichinella sp. T6]|nr:hypothetical protein T06_11632 [Trichinella sp. T6]